MGKRTVEENCDQLFEYLKSTLYDSTPIEVKVEDLDPEFQKLGMGIAYTQHLIKEMEQYSADISTGNLNPQQPSRDNLLCSNLKNLHSNLKHLTWQAQQVAKGDYTQHVSYLGEFSESFNEMIHQLKEREEAIKRRTMMMEEYNRFFLEISSEREEWIFIVSQDTKELVYCNREIEDELVEYIIGLPESDYYHQHEVSDGKGNYYEISLLHMVWQEKKAIGYVVKDITKEKAYSDNLTHIAYNDALTGVKNRQFFDAYIETLDHQTGWDTFCFMDLDGLKHVNDYFGHEEGDEYIQSFTDIIQQSFRPEDILVRMGGDEFCLFCKNITVEHIERKLERIRDKFISANTKEYEVSFSYGVVGNSRDLQDFEQVVKLADERMYNYKKLHKKERREY